MKKKYNVAMVDDENYVFDIVRSDVTAIFEKAGYLCQFDAYTSAIEFEEVMEVKKYDLLLLDIEMPRENGISFARRIRKLHNAITIIYVSGNTERVFDTFETKPFAFVRKGFFREDIKKELTRFIEWDNDHIEDTSIPFRKKFAVGQYRPSEIIYIEGSRNSKILYLTNNTSEEIYATMEEAQSKLEKYSFYRVHKSFIVNFMYVKEIQTNEIVMVNGTRVPISRGKEREIRGAFLNYLRNNGGQTPMLVN